MQKYFLIILSIIFIISFSVQPDVFMKQKHHTDEMAVMGQKQPAQDMIQNIWITKDKIKSDSEEKSVIMLLSKKIMYVFNHEEKTYFEMPMDFAKAMDKAMDGSDEAKNGEMAKFMQMAQGMMKFEITVTPTNETKTINKWKCKKYNQEVKMGMGPVNSEIWATEELKMDYQLYAQFSTAMMSMQPGFKDSFSKAMKEMEKIKGVPVLTKTNMKMMGMEMKSSQELLEFKEGTAPKGTFDIPKGYKKTEMMEGF